MNNDDKYDFEAILKFLSAISYDPLINRKVINILKLESYPRHIVLSNWLEQLRLNNASENLTKTLSYLFDDKIAEKVYDLINKAK